MILPRPPVPSQDSGRLWGCVLRLFLFGSDVVEHAESAKQQLEKKASNNSLGIIVQSAYQSWFRLAS